MNLEEKIYKGLKGQLSFAEIKAAYPIFVHLKTAFGFNDLDICKTCIAVPKIFSVEQSLFIDNLEKLSTTINLKTKDFKNLVLKCSKVLFMKSEVFRHKLELISIATALPQKDAIRYFYFCPELLDLNKEHLMKQAILLSSSLNEYGLGLRKLIKQEPKLLFIKEGQIDELKKYFMRSFGITEEEIENVIKAVPSLLFEPIDELNKKFSVYYPTLFIKRDIKEILQVCPEFVSLSPNDVIKKIKTIQQYFNISEKKACEFIRNVPNILFFSEPEAKFSYFEKFNISKKYIVSFPEICDTLEILFPIKFILARILGLEQEFYKLLKTSTKELIAKFLFMQKMKVFSHKDLLLDSLEFEKKYNISTTNLLRNFKLTENNVINLCKYYVSNQENLVDWQDIPFPKPCEIIEILNTSTATALIKESSLIAKKGKESVLQFFVDKVKLSKNEAFLVLSKNKFLENCNLTNLSKIINMLIKYGLDKEQILLLLINKPSLFTHEVFDLAVLLDEIIEEENYTILEAINNL